MLVLKFNIPLYIVQHFGLSCNEVTAVTCTLRFSFSVIQPSYPAVNRTSDDVTNPPETSAPHATEADFLHITSQRPDMGKFCKVDIETYVLCLIN